MVCGGSSHCDYGLRYSFSPNKTREVHCERRGKWQHHSLSCACVSPGAFSDFWHIGDAHGEVRLRYIGGFIAVSVTCLKNMAQKLHDKESSNEDEIFNRDAG